MKEEIKIEELNGIELLKLIYKEVKNNSEAIIKLKERIYTYGTCIKSFNNGFFYINRSNDNGIYGIYVF